MAIVSKYRNGVPNWVDVSAPDLGVAARFYSELFGWTAHDQGPEAGNYHMFTLGDLNVAGLGQQMNPELPPSWSTYLAVDDLDATLEAVAEAGGVVVAPRIDIFTSGSMAIAIDPSGAPVSFWQAGDHIGCQRVNEANTLVWNELTTRDVPAAAAFYGAVVGHRYTPNDADAPAGYQLIGVGDRMVGGVMPMEGEMWGDLPSHWMPYFAVDDADATAARAQELGGGVAVDPIDIPVGRFVVLTDPAGAVFTAITMAGELEEPPDGVA